MDDTTPTGSPDTGFLHVAGRYLDLAFDQMLDLVERVGDRLDDRPLGLTTNAVGALVFHCTEVCEFWLGHAALGRPSDRHRDEEFSTALPVDELRTRVAAARAQAHSDLAALEAGRGVTTDLRGVLPAGGNDASVVLHVVEELFQHIGQMELTADVFRSEVNDGR